MAGLFGPVDHYPSIAITSPADGAVVAGSVMITAEASDDSAVVQVAFFLDESLIGIDIDGAENWSTLWNSTTVPDGVYTLTATATDDAGQSTSTAIVVFVDNIDSPPVANAGPDQVVTDSDGSGSVLVQLDGTASTDDRAIVSYEWFVGDELIATGPTPEVDFAVGSHSVLLVVTDSGGQTDVDTVTIIVEAAPPASANDMYVWDIAFESRVRGNGKKLDDRVVVVVRRDSDADGMASSSDAFVEGAVVGLEVRNASGDLIGSYSGTTDAIGLYATGWSSTIATDAYVAEVVALAHTTYTWNQNPRPGARQWRH